MDTLMTWDRLHPEPPEESAQTDSWPPLALRASKPPPGAAARVTPPPGADDTWAGRAGRDRQAAPGPLTDTARPPDIITPSGPLANDADSRRAEPSWYGCDKVHEVPSSLDQAPSRRAAVPWPATSSAASTRPARAICRISTCCPASAAGSAGPVRDQRPLASRK